VFNITVYWIQSSGPKINNFTVLQLIYKGASIYSTTLTRLLALQEFNKSFTFRIIID